MPTTLITGANRGIGLEFVRQYAADGWDVIACCRTPDTLQDLARENKKVRIENLDVTDEKSISALAAKLKDTAIDLLINNAGVFSGSRAKNANDGDAGQEFGTVDAEAWDKVLRINSIAPVMVAQAFAPLVARGKERKMVMITSRMGSISEMGNDYIAYRSSKAALNAAMVTISHDLKEQKITIANLHPGWVQTDMGGPNAQITPEKSVTGMRKVIAGLTLAATGQFLNYEGNVIAW